MFLLSYSHTRLACGVFILVLLIQFGMGGQLADPPTRDMIRSWISLILKLNCAGVDYVRLGYFSGLTHDYKTQIKHG